MDRKTIITTVVTAVITLLVAMVIGWIAGVFEAGTNAISEQQIETVIRRVMVTDSGKTYAATLAEVNGTLIEINTKVDGLENDLQDIRGAVRALAAE